MEKFVKFCGDISEKDDRTPEFTWIENVSEQLTDTITNVKKFNITEETLEKEAKKRKNWTANGIDGIKTSGGRVKTIKKGIEESI